MKRTVLVLVPLLAGCNDTDKPPLFIPDEGVNPDGVVAFIGECKRDSDCASGHCIEAAGTRRCSRDCSGTAACPAFPQWSCNTTQGFCQCNGTGTQPGVCGVDGDCDGTPDRPPGKEICNDEDDDCNGEVDDVTAGTSGAAQYYRDEDGDSFGDDATARWMCKASPGWVTKGGDCDDQQEEDNPDATELCGDLRDNDCDGQKEDPDLCGLVPPTVADLTGSDPSGSLKTCSTTPGLQQSLDITEIVAKQDATALKFTVRLLGGPATTTCTSYILRLGDPSQAVPALVYVYRPAITACGATPALEAFHNGQPLSTTVKPAFNVGTGGGHVSFTLDKAEIFPLLPSPTYSLEACVNAQADPVKDKTDCVDDSCKTPVHR